METTDLKKFLAGIGIASLLVSAPLVIGGCESTGS